MGSDRRSCAHQQRIIECILSIIYMFIYIFMKTQFQTPLRKDGGVLISLSPYLFLSWCHEWNLGQHECPARTLPLSYVLSLHVGLCLTGWGLSKRAERSESVGPGSPTETSALIFPFMSRCATGSGCMVGGVTWGHNTSSSKEPWVQAAPPNR